MHAKSVRKFSVVEACAGAGGQSLGLHRAGFQHDLAVELDPLPAETLRNNLKVPVAVGDVANDEVWKPSDYRGVDLFAGGVPCPPFSVAGRQLGATDERDLFAWAIEQVDVIQPRAVMLENVRGLAAPRFSAYRQRILNRLDRFGYVGEWRLLTSADYGVPQLRPRFVLVAMRPEDHLYFKWPDLESRRTTVGAALHSLMAADGWRYADEWKGLANDIGPTIVGGSKKHGGADLGPTRAKEAWSRLFVDGRGIADAAPSADSPSPHEKLPRLTLEMAARIQGWTKRDKWEFAGRKTAQYRQIGNAFPPPVAEAVGARIRDALNHEGVPRESGSVVQGVQDPVYQALARADRPLTLDQLLRAEQAGDESIVERKIVELNKDFEVEVIIGDDKITRYRLGEFRGFTGQQGHARNAYITAHRNRVS